jgi:tRNA (guanine37-N1)-methyltransferase
VGSIASTFRTFELELLAGDPNLSLKLVESGVTFEFTYGSVYWNSKLQHEHARVLALLQLGDVVADLFAGVGPFAVPAAKYRGCRVLANDLNPRSADALEVAARGCGVPVARIFDHSIEASTSPLPAAQRALAVGKRGARGGGGGEKELDESSAGDRTSRNNGSSSGSKDGQSSGQGRGALPTLPVGASVAVGNMDAAAFVAACASLLTSAGGECSRPPDHVLMNLPALAVSFLPALAPWRPRVTIAAGAGKATPAAARATAEVAAVQTTRVHCYTFSTAADPLADAVAQVERGLGDVLPGALAAAGCLAYVHLVRSVAPGKAMVCVGFDLPPATLAF